MNNNRVIDNLAYKLYKKKVPTSIVNKKWFLEMYYDDDDFLDLKKSISIYFEKAKLEIRRLKLKEINE